MSICHSSIDRARSQRDVVGLLPLPGLGRDQPVTDQTPVDRRPPRHRIDALRARASDRSSAAPNPGCSTRISTIRASTIGAI